MQWTDNAYKAMVADLTSIVAAPVLGLLGATNLKVAPITAITNQTRTALIADVTLATFTGSTPQTVVFNTTPVLDEGGLWIVTGTSLLFTTTGDVPETVLGMVYLSGAGPFVLEGIDMFTTPVPMSVASDGFQYVPRVHLPAGPWEGGTVVA